MSISTLNQDNSGHESTQHADSVYELNIRIGGAEFHGKGRESVVRADFQSFVQAASMFGGEQLVGKKVVEKIDRESDDDSDPVEGNWDRVFKRTDDQLSLLLLPNGKFRNADSIVLLIYGYQKLYGQDGVPVTLLMESAKQSGLRIDRVNRNLPKAHQQFLITGGTGKGARYSLNNRGMAYAQELLEGMFE